MKKLMFLLSLVVLCNDCFAQKPISLGVGYGLDYGGLGAKISVALTNTNSAAIVGGFGNYFGPPLSAGGIMPSDNPGDEFIQFTNKNLKGFGYSVGIEYAYYSEWARGGVHYISTGKYDGEKSIPGINWCIFGGNYYFEKMPLFINYGVNCAFLFCNNSRMGLAFGASIGIGYSFNMSR
jgi:hypothetical protein